MSKKKSEIVQGPAPAPPARKAHRSLYNDLVDDARQAAKKSRAKVKPASVYPAADGKGKREPIVNAQTYYNLIKRWGPDSQHCADTGESFEVTLTDRVYTPNLFGVLWIRQLTPRSK